MPLLDATLDEEAMVWMAVAEVDRKVETDDEQIEAVVRRTVHELFGEARIKNFVGVIAARHAVEELRAA